MLKGEFESSKEVYQPMSDFIPEPCRFGRYYASDQVTYFYLFEFVDVDIATAPDLVEFTSRLAELHKRSKSPIRISSDNV